MPIKYLSEVRKKKGYPFPGTVVSTFSTLSGDKRYVVESTSEGTKGCLHIFNEGQLEVLK